MRQPGELELLGAVELGNGVNPGIGGQAHPEPTISRDPRNYSTRPSGKSLERARKVEAAVSEPACAGSRFRAKRRGSGAPHSGHL
jgi:hypothetical protein